MKLLSILKSFYYAFCGFFRTIKFERNFRIHITATIYVSLFAHIYGLGNVEMVLLILTFFNVLALELINTSIEAAVDLNEQKQNTFARTAKDAAAAAVMLASVAAVIIAVFLFGDKEKLYAAFLEIIRLPNLIYIILSLIPAILFIRGFWREKNK